MKLTPEQMKREKVYQSRANMFLKCVFGFIIGYWVLAILTQVIKGGM